MAHTLENFLTRERGSDTAWLRRSLIGATFGLAVLLIVMAGYALDGQIRQQSVAADWVRHTRDVELQLTRLQFSLTKAESAVRGFTISGKPAYLASYEAAKAEAPALLDSLRKLTADNPERPAQLAVISDLIAQKFAILEQGIDARKNDAAALAQMIAKGQGKIIMDQLQQASGQVMEGEEVLLAQRQASSAASIAHGLFLARLGAGVGIALMCLAFAWVALSMHLRGKAERIARAALIERDASDELRRKRESQLYRDQSSATVGRLAAGLAHVLNNALMVILGHADLMTERSGQSTADLKSLAAISKSATTAAALTDKFRSFGQRQMLSPEEVDPNDLLDDLKHLVGATLVSGIAVDLAPGPGSLRCLMDKRQLMTALTAIFENAVEAMPNGGELMLSCTERNLTSAEASNLDPALAGGRYAEITIADTGIGMTEDVRRHAFEPFYSTKDASLGAGLGLAMAYGFLKQSKGHIALESRVNSGTVVKVLLPASDAESMMLASNAA